MTWIENKIDRFCREHPNFGIPNLMLYIAIANAAIGLIDSFSMSEVTLSSILFFYRPYILQGQIWRIFTFVLLPQSGNLFLLLLSAYFYYWIGSTLEREWGTARFTLFYASGILFNIIFGFIFGYADMHYINLSMFFSFAFLFPDMQVLVMFFLPVKMKWLAWIDAILFAWDVVASLISRNFLGALLPIVAILNFFIFFWGDIIERINYRKQRFQHQHSAQTINFKKATKSVYQEKGYLHKCAVCGKTDTDYPDMEFRYCSKCNGSYCYCEEHINNHAHIE